MKENYLNNDPEKAIFGKKLGFLEIEPSEKFWYSALNGIIDRERSRASRQLRIWKTVSLVLGAMLLLLILHDELTNLRFSKIEAELTELNTAETKIQHEYSNGSTAANNMPVLRYEATEAKTSRPTPPKQNNSFLDIGNIHRGRKSAQPLLHGKNQQLVQVDASSAKRQMFEKTPLASDNRNNNKSAAKEPQAQIQESLSPDMSNKPNEVNSKSNPSKQVVQSANIKSQPILDTSATAPPHVSATQAAITDSASLITTLAQPKHNFILKNKLSISAFFAPAAANNFMKGEETEKSADEQVSASQIKAGEGYEFAYNAGIKGGLDISKKFTICTGFYYNSYSYDIKQSVITARRQENGSTGYSIETSSGIVYCPYSGGNPNPGDSITVRGNAVRSYMCVPLQLSYSFYSSPKLRLNIVGGLVTEIAINDATDIWWQNTRLQDGNANVQNTEGIRKFLLGYTFGLETAYNLGKGFSMFIEPEIQAPISSINSNTPVITYPYFLSLGAGICYHL